MKEQLQFVKYYGDYNSAYRENNTIILRGPHNEHRFTIWENLHDVPVAWFVWNIGKNMPDGWLPLARCIDSHNRPYDIDPDSLIAVPIKEAQTILDGIGLCGGSLEKMEKAINRNKEKGYKHNAERLEKAWQLLKQHGYNYGR